LEESKDTPKYFSIYIQSAIAMIIIQLLHKIVEELGTALILGDLFFIPSIYFTIAFIIGYMLAITLIVFKNKWGLIIGIALGIESMVQPILIHVILAWPKNPIYYPIFTFMQGFFVTYFCYKAYKNLQF